MNETTKSQKTANPLSKFYRAPKIYMKLPSNFKYSPSVVELNELQEVAVLSMTAKDEVIFRNPDALLNGDAIYETLKSCIPAIRDPKKILSIDANALLVGIRYATYGKLFEIEAYCPKEDCKHKNTFNLDLEEIVNKIQTIDSEGVVPLENVTIVVRPHTLEESLKALIFAFEENKLRKALENKDITDEDKLKIMSDIINNMSQLTVKLMIAGIVRVVNEQENIDVTNKDHIAEFLKNISKAESELISEEIKKINAYQPIPAELPVQCSKCKHEWINHIEYNPVSFFTNY